MRPTLADYRAKIEALYPWQAPFIGVAFSEDSALQSYENLKKQIGDFPAEKFSKHYVKILEESDPATRSHWMSGATCHADFGAGTITSIFIRKNADIRGCLAALTGGKLLPMRSIFNEAAMKPEHVQWFIFYHELCHATKFTGAYADVSPLVETGDEVLCDSYAALNLLKDYGDAALPFLEVWSDMRLARFATGNVEYLVTPALRSIIDQYRQGGLPPLNGLSGDDIFSIALKEKNAHGPDQDAFDLIEGLIGMARTRCVRNEIQGLHTDFAGYLSRQFEIFVNTGSLDKVYASLLKESINVLDKYRIPDKPAQVRLPS